MKNGECMASRSRTRGIPKDLGNVQRRNWGIADKQGLFHPCVSVLLSVFISGKVFKRRRGILFATRIEAEADSFSAG
jgi:hypothetical protein